MHRTASRALALALTVLASTACGARTDVAPFDASRTPTVDAGTDAGTDAGECVAACGARRCGPDPVCGRSCGSCGSGETCTSLGACAVLQWSPVASPTTAWLNEVWGSAADDVWVVGGNALEAGSIALLHYDGRAWSSVLPPTRSALYGVWGFARDDVWAVGGGGVILHFDGRAWAPVTSPEVSLCSGCVPSWRLRALLVGSLGVETGSRADRRRGREAIEGPPRSAPSRRFDRSSATPRQEGSSLSRGYEPLVVFDADTACMRLEVGLALWPARLLVVQSLPAKPALAQVPRRITLCRRPRASGVPQGRRLSPAGLSPSRLGLCGLAGGGLCQLDGHSRGLPSGAA